MRRRLSLTGPPAILLALVAQAALFMPGHAQTGEEEDLQWSIIAPLADRSLLLDAAATADKLVLVGERGHLLISNDDGQTWTQVRVPTRATLTGVYFADPDNGWAVGHDAVIIRTTDGGVTWERVHFAPEEERPLLDVWFEDAEHGIAVGAYGYFLETFDGGETWEDRLFEVVAEEEPGETAEADEGEPEEITSALDMMDFLDDEDPISDLHLNNIEPAGDGTLYLAAEAGHIFRSDDGGANWVEPPSPYDGSFYGSLPLGDDALLLFGLRGNLFYSPDRGESWEKIEIGTDAILMGAGFSTDGRPAIAGLGGTLLMAEMAPDKGPPTFELLQQEDRKALATLLPGADGGLILVGEDGVKTIAQEQLEAAAGTDSAGEP